MAAGTLLATLLALTAAAALLPSRSLQLLAHGLEALLPRLEEASSDGVPPGLRRELLTEVEAHAAWLAAQDPMALSPGAARAAAAAAEHLPLLLADDRLDSPECRRFIELSRGLRGTSEAGGFAGR